MTAPTKSPSDYAQSILTARVYDVAVESALDPMPHLSKRYRFSSGKTCNLFSRLNSAAPTKPQTSMKKHLALSSRTFRGTT
jgi:hypothetical protein